jgi:hypothetical protein
LICGSQGKTIEESFDYQGLRFGILDFLKPCSRIREDSRQQRHRYKKIPRVRNQPEDDRQQNRKPRVHTATFFLHLAKFQNLHKRRALLEKRLCQPIHNLSHAKERIMAQRAVL